MCKESEDDLREPCRIKTTIYEKRKASRRQLKSSMNHQDVNVREAYRSKTSIYEKGKESRCKMTCSVEQIKTSIYGKRTESRRWLTRGETNQDVHL